MSESHLVIDHVSKSFGSNQVVHDASLAVEQGEFVSFLGPSGCGKTTILRMVAGFEIPTTGRIVIDGKDVTNLKPNRRNIAGNIGFGLKVAGASSAEVAARVKETLAMIKLPQLEDRYPWQLSGGQQQRVALARALAPRPSVLLLDEPLSALDAKIRVSLREEIRSIQQSLGITTIFVTHDQEEALSMSDRVMVMNTGRIEQTGTPFEVYNRPATRFVASFVGTLSLVNVTVQDPAKGTLGAGDTVFSGITLPAGAKAGDRHLLALRPEALRVGAEKGRITLTGTVTTVDFLGSVIRIRMDAAGASISLDMFNDPTVLPSKPGDRIEVGFTPESVLLLPPDKG